MSHSSQVSICLLALLMNIFLLYDDSVKSDELLREGVVSKVLDTKEQALGKFLYTSILFLW